MTSRALFVGALLAAACGGSKKDGGGPAKPADPAAANAAIPADWQGKLTFVAATAADDHGLTFVAPKDWQTTAVPGMYRPADRDGMGFLTSYSVGTNCDGTCEAKDWAAVVDKVEFAQLMSIGTVERDDKSEGRRAVLVKDGATVRYAVAWWSTGARRYVSCRATLDGALAAAAPAFVAACDATNPRMGSPVFMAR